MQKTKVVTKTVRFSYLNVLEARSTNGGPAKYSTSIIIPKSDLETKRMIDDAIKAAYAEGTSKLQGSGRTVPALEAIRTPLRDGDKERPDDEAYAGSWFLNASSLQRPDVVDASCHDIIDPGQIYSGMYGRASLNFFAYSVGGNRGIGVGLNGIQKQRDGERLSGRSSAASDFADSEQDSDFLS